MCNSIMFPPPPPPQRGVSPRRMTKGKHFKAALTARFDLKREQNPPQARFFLYNRGTGYETMPALRSGCVAATHRWSVLRKHSSRCRRRRLVTLFPWSSSRPPLPPPSSFAPHSLLLCSILRQRAPSRTRRPSVRYCSRSQRGIWPAFKR